MALSMPRPWKHPKTGIYYLRRRVPGDLRATLGWEEKVSLKTREPAEAKRRHAAELAESEARWANLRAGSRSLTEREAHDLAVECYRAWLAQHRDNPSQAVQEWPLMTGEKLWQEATMQPSESALDFFMRPPRPEYYKTIELRANCEATASHLLSKYGMTVDEPSRDRMARAVSASIQRATVLLDRMSRGEPIETSPSLVVGSSAPPQRKAFDELIKGWSAEKRPVKKTIYEWSRVLREFSTFLGHDDASRVTPADMVRWKTKLIEQGLRPKTVRDAKLAPVRAIFQWGLDNNHLAQNAAGRVTLDVRAKVGEGRRSFTDAEATIVLRAALAAKDPVRRWVPWLCAYSGARVSEVCQLRKEDVIAIDGIWCLKFDPAAGSLKTRGSERIVPLHPEIMAVIEYVKTLPEGPLFPSLPPDVFGKRGGNGTKIIGRFVRDLGLTDPRLAPAHSWRHRFKTLGRRYQLQLDIVNAMTGHGRQTVADSYGEFPVDALLTELKKIPALQLIDL